MFLSSAIAIWLKGDLDLLLFGYFRAMAASIALIFVATEAAAVVAIESIVGLIVSGISKAIFG